MVDLSGPNSKKCQELFDLVQRTKSGSSNTDYRSPSRNIQKQVRLSVNEAALLCCDYREGATVYELAAKYGCHRNSVSAHLKRNGVKMRVRSLTEDQILQAIELYESGLSLVKVKERMGVTSETIRLRLIERGVVMRDSHGRLVP